MQIADSTKSTIKRCQHGVYNPNGTPNGTDNDVCSLCTPLTIPEGYRYVYARNESGAFRKIEDLL